MYVQMCALIQTTAPAKTPVTLTDVKGYCHATDSEDSLIEAFLVAATNLVERYTKRALITQQFKQVYDALPAVSLSVPAFPSIIEVLRPPLISVQSVKYYTEDDVEHDFPVATNLYVDTNSEPGRLALRSAASWPTDLRPINSVHVNFTAGYGANETNVPEPLKLAIRKMVACMYDCRGSNMDISKMPVDCLLLMDPYKVFYLA